MYNLSFNALFVVYYIFCSKHKNIQAFTCYLRRLYLHWEMKGHGLLVNLVKHDGLLKDLHATRVLSFPNENGKSVLIPA